MGVLANIFGKKIKYPDAPTSQQIVSETFDVNEAAFPRAEKQAEKINRTNQAAVLSQFRTVFPQFDELFNKGVDIIGDELEGQLSLDDIAWQQNQTVARQLGAGTGASFGVTGGRGGNVLARDLGLRSLDIQQHGLSTLDRWTQIAQGLRAPTFDVSNFQLTIPQQTAITGQQYARDIAQAGMNAAPDPVTRGLFDTSMTLVTSLYGGGYEGTYKPSWDESFTPTTRGEFNANQGGGFRFFDNDASGAGSWNFGYGGLGVGRQSGGGFYLGRGPGPG